MWMCARSERLLPLAVQLRFRFAPSSFFLTLPTSTAVPSQPDALEHGRATALCPEHVNVNRGSWWSLALPVVTHSADGEHVVSRLSLALGKALHQFEDSSYIFLLRTESIESFSLSAGMFSKSWPSLQLSAIPPQLLKKTDLIKEPRLALERRVCRDSHTPSAWPHRLHMQAQC